MVKETKFYDVLILGAGMAGLTAGLYTVRYNLKTAIVSKDFGGTGNIAGFVENWPGFVGGGLDLMQKIVEQVKAAGVDFIQGQIVKVEKDEKGFFVDLGNEIIHGKGLIIALGMQHRKLNVKGEEEFLGKGVSYCATCDGMFFKNKVIAVVGGGDSASKAALYLSEICKKVYLIHRRNELKCEPIAIEQMKNKNNIEMHMNSFVGEVLGEKKVKQILLKSVENKPEMKLDVDGVFIEIGAVPMVEVIKDLGLNVDKGGFILTNKDTKTNVDGIFAAGDNTDTKFKQFVVSAGEGAVAAKEVYDYLRFRYKK